MRLIVVPDVHRKAAETAVRAALVETAGANDTFAVTLIRLPGQQEWRITVSGSGQDQELALQIRRNLHAAAL